MSLMIKNKQNKKSLLSLTSTGVTNSTTVSDGDASIATKIIQSYKYPTTKLRKSSFSSFLLLPADDRTPSSVDGISSSSSSISAISLFSRTDQQQSKEISSGSGRKVFRTMPSLSFKIMSYQNIIAFLMVLICGLVTVNGLKCYMCGQYNEGVGSITPCLNYSEQYAHLYLKECSKKSEKYCVKYVSELSIVRDCATECAEKEIWETQTYCCTEDGCNGSSAIDSSAVVTVLPLIIYVANEIINLVKQQYR